MSDNEKSYLHPLKVAPRFFGPYYIVAEDGEIVAGPFEDEPAAREKFAARWWEQPGHYIVRMEGIVIAGAVSGERA